MSHDEPRSLRDALAGVSRELGLPDPDRLATVLAAWPRIVGDELAAHARVQSVRDGVLVVAVDAPAFATQLRYLETDVRDGCARHVGDGVVRSLRVVVDRVGNRG
jgi:predicted nucleic acid-binding Zn ribbon protein